MSLLEVTGLVKTFGGLRALDNVTLTVAEGTIHGLMGANGAGKTTLFSIIVGNQRPTSGNVRFAGERIDRLRPDQICRKGIARTFQIVRPFAQLTVRENVETAVLFGRVPLPRGAEIPALVNGILEECGLADLADRPASALTLSARKRLEVARALGTGPRLLLDEPTLGLAPAIARQIFRIVPQLRDMGITVLIAEQDLHRTLRIADQVYVLENGAVAAQGSGQDLARDPAVRRAYLGHD